MMMKQDLSQQQNQPQNLALAGVVMILTPVFFPHLFAPLSRASPSILSEWNAPEPMHISLVKSALQRQIPFRQQLDLWSPLPFQGWKPCIHTIKTTSIPKKSQGYIQVFLDGGLNQQRMGICDAVVVAKILNATLVIPHLEVNAVWQDSSSFDDIFDVDHFIKVLENDVRIVKKLPGEFSWSTREYYATGIRDTRVKTALLQSSANWHLETVLPILQRVLSTGKWQTGTVCPLL